MSECGAQFLIRTNEEVAFHGEVTEAERNSAAFLQPAGGQPGPRAGVGTHLWGEHASRKAPAWCQLWDWSAEGALVQVCGRSSVGGRGVARQVWAWAPLDGPGGRPRTLGRATQPATSCRDVLAGRT